MDKVPAINVSHKIRDNDKAEIMSKIRLQMFCISSLMENSMVRTLLTHSQKVNGQALSVELFVTDDTGE